MLGHVDKCAVARLLVAVLIFVVEVAPLQWKSGDGFEPQRRFDAKEASVILFISSAVRPQIKRGLSNKPLNLTAFPAADVR